MEIRITAKPGASRSFIGKIGKNHFEVAVKEPPVERLANRAIIKAVADYFNVPIGTVRIVSGWKGRRKKLWIETAGN